MSGWTQNDRDMLVAAGIAMDDQQPLPFDARAAEAMIAVHRENEVRLKNEVRYLKVIVIGLLCAALLALAVAVAKGKV
jgi:Na+(H+)/acetate symporter ActP